MSRPVVSVSLLLPVSPCSAPLGEAAPGISQDLEADPTQASAWPASSAEMHTAVGEVTGESIMTPTADPASQPGWLTAISATVGMLVVLWFVRAYRRRVPPGRRPGEPATSATAARSGKKERPRNATITIRNAATQQAELVERVKTRSLFRSRKAPPPPPVIPSSPVTPTPAPLQSGASTVPPAITAPAAARTRANPSDESSTSVFRKVTTPERRPAAMPKPEIAEVKPDPQENALVRIVPQERQRGAGQDQPGNAPGKRDAGSGR